MSNRGKTGPVKPGNRDRGRPRKGDAPEVDWHEVDRLLVFGEKVKNPKTDKLQVYYPSYAELAKCYGVSKARIWQYSMKRTCMKRRREAAARVEIRYEQKMVERRSDARALTTEDELRIIDEYIRGFEQAVKEGRVRYDNPADFNTMVRLKELKLGRADSRQEMHNLVSLEEIQARHKALQARLAGQEPALTGRVDDTAPPRETDGAVDEKADDAIDVNGGSDAGVPAAASFRVETKAEAGDEETEDN